MNRLSWLGADAPPPELLWGDGEREFYKISRPGQGGEWQPYIAVLPSAPYPTPSTLSRIAHEFDLKDHLDGSFAMRPLELVRDSAQTVLLLEYGDGQPLDRLIGAPIETATFLRLAIALTTALGRLHERGLVHKDVKPANILVDAATEQVRLTGFGIATRLPRERQSPEPPELIAGTLSHMAPEQTGRMNRSIDARSDLYSLGVTLYQMLTGSLPFTASDPMAWVHCHVAKTPTPPTTRLASVPSQLSAIVMKLLAKTPEERYQTAAGVQHDLQRCLTLYEGSRAIEEFPLAARDRTERLRIAERLYGREAGVDALLAAFHDVVASGKPRLVLVCGPPGIGKSSLVNELHKVLLPGHGLVASGKFDRLKRDVPYVTLAHAFQRLIHRLLASPEAELREWRNKLRDALHPNGALVLELIPDLRFIIGEQPPVPDVPSPAARVRFQMVLRRFIGVFARPEHPLALFLDDLQWIDAATLELLDELLAQPDLQPLLLVGAYRDNEVDAAHPLTRKLAAIRQRGADVAAIVLEPLSNDELADLLGDALHSGPLAGMQLARLVHEKTGGNPFFVHQFIHALADEGLLAFDPRRAQWDWDPESIQAKGYTENVVDLMAGKVSRLPANTREALKELACLGNSAGVSTLAIVRGTSEADVEAELWEALRSSLIVRSADAYQFIHDRIEEAAYSLIPEERRAEAHLRIGRLLMAHVPPDRRDEAIFEIAGQLNRGSALIVSRDEREELAELNLNAGRRAKAAAAFASALTYLSAGTELLGEDSWERRPGLSFALSLHRAECEFLTGQVTSAEERLLALSSRALGAVERAAITCLLADIYVALQRLDRSVAVCLDYLRHAGLDVPLQPTGAQTQAAYDRVWSRLGDRELEKLAELPLMTDPGSRATLDVLAKIARCALTQMDMGLLSLILCAAVELSLESGNADSSSYAYAYFGVVAAWQFGDFEAGFRFGQVGHDLVEKKGLRHFEAVVCLALANRLMPWARHVSVAQPLVRRAFDRANESGDRIAAVSSRCVLVSHLLMAGTPLADVEVEAESGLAFCQRAGFRDFIDCAGTQAALIRNLRGLTRQFGSLDDDRFDELLLQSHFASQPHAPVFECWYWIRRLQARFLAADYTAALDSSYRARALLFSSIALIEIAEYELYTALTHAAVCDAVPADERRAHLDALVSHHCKLELWARHCPDNFENRALLVAAEIARLEEREADAMRLYEQAMRSARQNGFLQGEALAAELAARFYAGRGFDRIARAYMRDARNGYLQWGADGKVRQLEDRYPYCRDEDQRPDPGRTVQTPVEHLDLQTVLTVLQLVSGETDVPRLIATILRLSLEHAGAQRGLLILARGDAYGIEAEATVAEDVVSVALTPSGTGAEQWPDSVIRYVLRTKEPVLLNDGSAGTPFADDEYLRGHRTRSALCLPLLKQGRVVGLVYLENNLAPGVFTPRRVAVLQLLASEAAITLENARLYRDLQEREGRVRRLVDSNIIGIAMWHADGRILDANESFLRTVGYGREDLVSGRVRWTDLTPPEWHDRDVQTLAELAERGAVQAHEREYIRKDGARVPVLAAGAVFDGAPQEGVAFVLDLTERKRTEQALRDTEREARLILDAIPGMVGLLSPTGHVDAVNLQLLEYFGQTLEELREWGTNGTVHPDDVPHVAETFTRAIEAGTPYNILQRFRRSDGVYRWFENRGFPLRDPTGRIVRWCVLLTDIDEGKRAEAALKRSEHNLKLTVDTIPALAWSTGPDGSADFFNQHYLDFVGLSAEQASGWGWTAALHPDDLNALATTWQRILASEAPGEAEARLRRHDGEYRWFLFRANPLRDESGGIAKWYGVNTDIEDRKRAETELKRAYDSFADAQRLSHTGSFITDLVGDDHNWSEETYRIFEFAPGTEVSVQRIRDIIHPDDLPPFDAMIARAMSGEDVTFSFRIVTAGGALKHVRGVAHVIEKVEGRPMFVGALQDVTETAVAEEALNRARSELAHVARVSTLNALTASIAHEVNQPLSGIVTNASTCLRMLDADPPNLDGARETARRTIRDGHRASDVITRLRALFSRREFMLEPLDLNEAVREVVALSLSELQRHRVVLRSELADDLPVVKGDRIQLQQVILNLLRNATDAMTDVHDRPRQLSIRTDREDGGRVRVTVRDAGVGVDSQSIDKLFDAFYTTKSDGMGIGLSVSRSIIERHDGRLWAEPNDGPGATFVFSIPCNPESVS